MARKNALLDVLGDAYVRGMARNVNALAEIAGKPFPDPRVYARGAEFVPGVGDAVGLGQDVRGYVENPNSLTPLSGLLSLAALLPGIPRGLDDAGKSRFIERFRGSKVVDDAGDPLPMLHGTNAAFDDFSQSKVGARFPEYSIGMHFTNRAEGAAIYADDIGGNIRPAYLNAKNPLVIDTDLLSPEMEADINRAEIVSKLVSAKKAGSPYDSVIIRRKRGDEFDGMNVIVFSPDQVLPMFGAY